VPHLERDEWLTATLTNRVSDKALLGCTTLADLENYVGHILDEAYAADVRVFDDWTDPVRWLWWRRRRLVADREGDWIGLLTHALSKYRMPSRLSQLARPAPPVRLLTNTSPPGEHNSGSRHHGFRYSSLWTESGVRALSRDR
jgi:hypothetical protein